MKDTVKVARTISAKSGKEAGEKLAAAYKAIDKSAKSGFIKKNTASRMKSRLAKAAKKAAGK